MKKQINVPTPGERKRLYVYITEEDKDKLIRIAAKNGQSVSVLVNGYIEKELENEIILDLTFGEPNLDPK